MLTFAVLIAGLLFGIVSAAAAKSKGLGGGKWFLVGFLLGPFGLIWVLVKPKDQATLDKRALQSGTVKKCPSCAELVKFEAVKCRYCGTDLPTAATDLTRAAPNIQPIIRQRLYTAEEQAKFRRRNKIALIVIAFLLASIVAVVLVQPLREAVLGNWSFWFQIIRDNNHSVALPRQLG